MAADVVYTEGSTHNKHHHHTKHHEKTGITKKSIEENGRKVVKDLHTSLNLQPTTNSTKRSIWDALNGANISVENHVHQYTAKSDIAMNQGNVTRRNLWDIINNSNISVENHVHQYTTRSNIGMDANSTRRDVWDLLKGANISIQNSVHSVTVRRSDLHNSEKEKDANNDAIARKSYVHVPPAPVNKGEKVIDKSKKDLLPMSTMDVTGEKRDEEPSEVAVQGKSPFDVAAAIEDNDQMVIPMLEKQHYKEMKKTSEDKVRSPDVPDYVISDQGHFPAEEDPFYFDKRRGGHRHVSEDDMYDHGGDGGYPKHMGHNMVNDEREMDDRDRESNNERENGRYNHEEDEERNDREEEDRRGGGNVEHYDKEERPSKMDDEGYPHHGMHEHGQQMRQPAFENGGERPERYDEEHGRGERENRYYKDNDNDRAESRGGPEESRRGEEDSDWEQEERPHISDHRNFHSRSHMHRGMHERYPNEVDRYHTSENDEEDYVPPNHRMIHEPHMEDFPARPSHIFDQKRGSDEYSDNIGRRERYNHRMRQMEPEDDRRSMEKARSPCDKKKSVICDDVHVDDYDARTEHAAIGREEINDLSRTKQEQISERQVNPFDPHDMGLFLNNRVAGKDDIRHGTINPPNPESVLQIASDPSAGNPNLKINNLLGTKPSEGMGVGGVLNGNPPMQNNYMNHHSHVNYYHDNPTRHNRRIQHDFYDTHHYNHRNRYGGDLSGIRNKASSRNNVHIDFDITAGYNQHSTSVHGKYALGIPSSGHRRGSFTTHASRCKNCGEEEYRDIEDGGASHVLPPQIRRLNRLPQKELPMFQIGTVRHYTGYNNLDDQHDHEHRFAEYRDRSTSTNLPQGYSPDTAQPVPESPPLDDRSVSNNEQLPPTVTSDSNQIPFSRERVLPVDGSMRDPPVRGPPVPPSNMVERGTPPLSQQGLLTSALNPNQHLTNLPERSAEQKAQISQTLSQISRSPNLVTRPHEVIASKKRIGSTPVYNNQPAFQVGDRDLEESSLRDNAHLNLEREQASEINTYPNGNSLGGFMGQPDFINMVETMKRKVTNPLHIPSLNESTVLKKIHDSERDLLAQNVHKEISRGNTSAPIFGKSIIEISENDKVKRKHSLEKTSHKNKRKTDIRSKSPSR